MSAASPWDRELTPEEFEAKVSRLLADEADRAGVRELIAWFTRRYPTPKERLAYVRRRMRGSR